MLPEQGLTLNDVPDACFVYKQAVISAPKIPADLEDFLQPITEGNTLDVMRHLNALRLFIDSVPIPDSFGTDHTKRRQARLSFMKSVSEPSAETSLRNPLRGNSLAGVRYSLHFLSDKLKTKAVGAEIERRAQELNDLLGGKSIGTFYKKLNPRQKIIVMATYKEVALEVLKFFTEKSELLNLPATKAPNPRGSLVFST